MFCEENAIGNLQNLFIVADGMGGHKAGDFASKHCVETVTNQIKQSNLKTPISIIEQAVQAANKSIVEIAESDEDFQGMGTTFVAATVIGNKMYVANIGDSRAYLIHEQIRQITEDHSLVEAMVKAGDLERKDAKSHPNKNVITRALGTSKMVSTDFFEVSLEEGDTVLLCSDGLTNMLEDEEILEIVSKFHKKLDKMGKELIKAANANGGKDNIAVVLIQP